MASRITREGERNIRANDFLQEDKADFAANTFATAQITALDAEIANTGNFYEEQISNDGGARQNYNIAAQAEVALKQAMDDIVDFAETMADEIEGIEEKFRRPRSGGKRGRIARARAFAADALQYKDIFIERGLDANFITALNAKADALEQSLANAVSETGARIGATESKMQSHKKANKIITALDPIVRKRYRDNPAKLAAWNFASHVQRDDQPKAKPENT